MLARLTAHAPTRLAFYALLALALVLPVLAHAAELNEFRDAQVMFLHERAAFDTVRRWGELPLWNPWYCGGMYALGAPQARFASPTFLATLLLGPERAEVLVAFLFAVLGMEGTYRWLSLRVRTAWAAALVAPIFALSGHFAVSFYRGWTNFWGFELVPWILFGVTLAARGRASGIAIASLAFAAVLGFGGTFAAPLVAVAVVVESLRTLSELGTTPRLRRGLGMLALTACFLVTASLFRLLPVAETLEAAPRIMAGTPGHAPKSIVSMLVSSLEVKNGDVERVGQFYVGGLFLALAAIGGSDRRSLRATFAAVVFVWLAAGYARKPALFALLRELPVLSALRYPERFLWLAILFASEPAARALEKVPALGEGRRFRVGAVAVLSLAIGFTLVSQIREFHRVAEERTLGALAETDPDAPFRQSRGNRWLAAHVQAQNMGSLSCWEVHPVVMTSRLRGDLAEEEYLADEGAGMAKRTKWAPNHIEVHVELAQATKLLVNQNWHPGWRANVGQVVSEDGLLAVDLPAGTHDVVLAFAPRSAKTGTYVSLAALAALALLLLAERRRPLFARRALPLTIAATATPLVVFAVMHFTWDEPRWPAPVPRNANGAPALVAAMPEEARALEAGYELPVRLEGALVRPPDERKNLYVDLYLRRTGKVPRTTAMFVHVERREKLPERPEREKKKSRKGEDKEPEDFFNADHQVIARSFFLSDAPANALVHDAFGVHLDQAAPGEWDVFVGFGHVSGRRGRAKIPDPGKAEVVDDRVKVGTFVVR